VRAAAALVTRAGLVPPPTPDQSTAREQVLQWQRVAAPLPCLEGGFGLSQRRLSLVEARDLNQRISQLRTNVGAPHQLANTHRCRGGW